MLLRNLKDIQIKSLVKQQGDAWKLYKQIYECKPWWVALEFINKQASCWVDINGHKSDKPSRNLFLDNMLYLHPSLSMN